MNVSCPLAFSPSGLPEGFNMIGGPGGIGHDDVDFAADPAV